MLAEREGVAGRDVTPFVLSRVAELTGGKSVDANLALIEVRRRKRRRLPDCQLTVIQGYPIPEVSSIKCDVRECVVGTSDSLENLTF